MARLALWTAAVFVVFALVVYFFVSQPGEAKEPGKNFPKQSTDTRDLFYAAKPCDVPAAERSSLVGGSEVKSKTRYPWMVWVRVNTPTGKTFCGGSLIDDRHVLTAAHCLRKKILFPTITDGLVRSTGQAKFGGFYKVDIVYVGGLNRSGIDMCFAAVSAAFVPATVSMIMNLDVALLRLSASLTSAPGWGSTIAPIALPDREEKAPRQCEISGWGKLRHNGPASNTLQRLDVRVYNFTECLKFDNLRESDLVQLGIDEGTICTDVGPTGGQDICSGDSGGPLVCNVNRNRGGPAEWKQFGIVSATDVHSPCGSANQPGYGSLYTSVPFVRSWIEYVAKPAMRDVSSTVTFFKCRTLQCRNLDYTLPYNYSHNEKQANNRIVFKRFVCPAVSYYIFCQVRDPQPDRCKESSVPAFLQIAILRDNEYVTVVLRRTAVAKVFEDVSARLRSVPNIYCPGV